jgi:O-antigen/teichoic acid export membrane protein
VKLRHAIPAGLLDAGLASLATFAAGAYAARFLTIEELGAYALFFSAYLLAAVVPSQLVLIPAVIASLDQAPSERIGLIGQTWRLGGPSAIVAALLAGGAAYVGANAPGRVLGPLAMTAIICSVVSPLQDQVRRTLHLSGTSWRAAVVSLIHLAFTIGALATGRAVGIQDVWLPFGALALGNLTSSWIGFLFSRPAWLSSGLPPYRMTWLMRSGRQLLILEFLPTLATLVASILITRLAGPAALGHAEAARIVSQPVLVMTMGLSAALGPRSMEAGAGRDRGQASRIARPFVVLLMATGLLYGAVTVTQWWGNPIGALVPKAYSVPGLVPSAVVAGMLLGVVFPYRSELVGARFLQPLLWLSALAGVLQCVAATSALWLGAFARPLSDATNGLVLWAGYRRYRERLYAAPPASTSAAADRT